MPPSRDEVLAALSPAQRARTIIAAGTHVAWRLGGATVATPYLDIDGIPVLVADEQTGRRLLTVGEADATMSAAEGLGAVMVSGLLLPMAPADLDGRAQESLAARHQCADSVCGSSGPTLVRVEVDRVRVTGTDDAIFATVPLSDYAAATPDRVIAEGWVVAQHLNTDHSTDVIALAARMSGRRADQVVAAAITWIDAAGLDLVLVDEHGAWPSRVGFDPALSSMIDLGNRLHHLTTP